MKNPAAGAYSSCRSTGRGAQAAHLPEDRQASRWTSAPMQSKLEASRYATVEAFRGGRRAGVEEREGVQSGGSDIYEVAALLETDFSSKLEVTSGPLREKGAASSSGGGGGGGDADGESLAQCKAAMRRAAQAQGRGRLQRPRRLEGLGHQGPIPSLSSGLWTLGR